jgi:hypothetical protein
VKIRSSTKIAIGFVAVLALSWFGYRFVTGRMIDGAVFNEIPPGRVSIVGIDAGAGFRIIVANQVAQLLEMQGGPGLARPEVGQEEGEKKRIPLREMLQTLTGDEEALGKLVTIMNDSLRRVELPPDPVIWEAEDLRKALDGDPELESRLVQDLNVRLDGSPPDFVNVNALENGIVIRAPVPVRVSVAGQEREMVGRVLIPYWPRFAESVYDRFKEEFERRPEQIKGFYIAESRKLLDDRRLQEDVRAALETRISHRFLENYARGPQRVLQSAKVVLNDDFIEGASYSSRRYSDGQVLHDLELELNDEGRRRLWQFSRRNPGVQLLVIVDGVAIAAPRIAHELAQGRVHITQIPDETLVKDTVDLLNSLERTARK